VTHEEEAAKIVGRCELPPCQEGCHRCGISKAISTALRKRDELYDAAWGECERWRKEAGYQRWITGNGEWAYMHPNKNDVYLIHEADAHDTLRREAGKEKA